MTCQIRTRVGIASASQKKRKGFDQKPPSKHFKSLLCGLLEKNVTRRMDWSELLRHPFWTETWNRKVQSKRSRVTLRNFLEPVFESFLREARNAADSKREHESHRVKKKKSKNDDEDVEDVIRLLRGAATKEEKDEEKQRIGFNTLYNYVSCFEAKKESREWKELRELRE